MAFLFLSLNKKGLVQIRKTHTSELIILISYKCSFASYLTLTWAKVRVQNRVDRSLIQWRG